VSRKSNQVVFQKTKFDTSNNLPVARNLQDYRDMDTESKGTLLDKMSVNSAAAYRLSSHFGATRLQSQQRSRRLKSNSSSRSRPTTSQSQPSRPDSQNDEEKAK
jgi:hypothetical protein